MTRGVIVASAALGPRCRASDQVVGATARPPRSPGSSLQLRDQRGFGMCRRSDQVSGLAATGPHELVKPAAHGVSPGCSTVTVAQ